MSYKFSFCSLYELFFVCISSSVSGRFMLTDNVKIAEFYGHTASSSKIECAMICSNNLNCCISSFHAANKSCLWHQNCSIPHEYSQGYITLSKYPDGECPGNYSKYQDHCYYLGTYLATWADAKMICKSRGEILAEPKTQEITTFLKNQTAMLDRNDWWIGGTDQYNPGTWVWDTTREVITTSDWYPGLPGSGPACLLMKGSYDYYWADRDCTKTKFFICQTRML